MKESEEEKRKIRNKNNELEEKLQKIKLEYEEICSKQAHLQGLFKEKEQEKDSSSNRLRDYKNDVDLLANYIDNLIKVHSKVSFEKPPVYSQAPLLKSPETVGLLSNIHRLLASVSASTAENNEITRKAIESSVQMMQINQNQKLEIERLSHENNDLKISLNARGSGEFMELSKEVTAEALLEASQHPSKKGPIPNNLKTVTNQQQIPVKKVESDKDTKGDRQKLENKSIERKPSGTSVENSKEKDSSLNEEDTHIADEVELALDEFKKSYELQVQFERLRDGRYMFGTRKLILKMLAGKLVIRVGGGYMQISDFVRLYSLQELKKLTVLKNGKTSSSTHIKTSADKRNVSYTNVTDLYESDGEAKEDIFYQVEEDEFKGTQSEFNELLSKSKINKLGGSKIKKGSFERRENDDSSRSTENSEKKNHLNKFPEGKSVKPFKDDKPQNKKNYEKKFEKTDIEEMRQSFKLSGEAPMNQKNSKTLKDNKSEDKREKKGKISENTKKLQRSREKSATFKENEDKSPSRFVKRADDKAMAKTTIISNNQQYVTFGDKQSSKI